MEHLEYEDFKARLSAALSHFLATVARVFGPRSSYFSTAGESRWLDFFDTLLVWSTGNVVYPTLKTTSSTRRRYESKYHNNPRCAAL